MVWDSIHTFRRVHHLSIPHLFTYPVLLEAFSFFLKWFWLGFGGFDFGVGLVIDFLELDEKRGGFLRV